jgi:hypothetical protein
MLYRYARLWEHTDLSNREDIWLFLWRILPRLMISRLLMANENYIKERLSVSYFLMPTDLKNLWWPVSKTIAIQWSTKEHDQPYTIKYFSIYVCNDSSDVLLTEKNIPLLSLCIDMSCIKCLTVVSLIKKSL